MKDEPTSLLNFGVVVHEAVKESFRIYHKIEDFLAEHEAQRSRRSAKMHVLP